MERQGRTWQSSTENRLASSAFATSKIFSYHGPREVLSASYKREEKSLLKNLSRVPSTYIIKLTLFTEAEHFPLGLSSSHLVLPTLPSPPSPVL